MDIETLIQKILEAKQHEKYTADSINAKYREIEQLEPELRARVDAVFDLAVELGKATQDMPDAEKQAIWARVR